MAHRVLRSFVEAYLIVGDRLEALGDRPAEEEAVVRDCLGLGRQYRLQRTVTSAEAVSTHLFRTALRLADNRELLVGGPACHACRLAFAAELHDVHRRLDEITRLDRGRYPC